MASQPQSLYCTECGKQRQADAKFCAFCGRSVFGEAESPGMLRADDIPILHERVSATPAASSTQQPERQALGKNEIIAAIILVVLGIPILHTCKTSKPASSAVSVTASPPTSLQYEQITSSKDGIGCVTSDALDRVISMASSKDQGAVASMLLSGQCEVIPSGTVLNLEGSLSGIFGHSRYRIRGTARALYLIPSTLH